MESASMARTCGFPGNPMVLHRLVSQYGAAMMVAHVHILS